MEEYLSPQEFAEILRSQPLETIVDERIFGGTPFVFRRRRGDEHLLRRLLAEPLGVSPEDVTVVGSGRTGFSLTPRKYGRRYSQRSDIDVVVVSAELFDEAWLSALRWSYPHFHQGGPERSWAAQQQFDIYRGVIDFEKTRTLRDFTTATFLKPLRRISARWFLAFQSLNRQRAFTGLDVKGRLYRTWTFARYYHIENLRLLKSDLAKEGSHHEV